MELKCSELFGGGSTDSSFNRTFMELKFGKDTTEQAEAKVLIVPLWN